MKEKLSEKFGTFGVFIYFLITIFVSVMPFTMIGAPFFVNIFLIAISQLVPFSTIVFWVWGLICALNGPRDWLANTYYYLFVFIFVPFFGACVLDFIDTKGNSSHLKTFVSAMKIVRSWGGNIRSMSITEKIVLHNSMLLTSISEQSDYFSNHYVCADALVISCTYVAYILKLTNAPQSLISSLETQVLCVLQRVFSISPPVSKKLYNDRFLYFTSIIAASEDDVTPMIEEASLVFSHDLYHNKYVPYDESSPVPITGLEEQFAISAETSMYFNRALQYTTEIFESHIK